MHSESRTEGKKSKPWTEGSPVHDSGVTILNILSIIKDIGWNGGCVCLCKEAMGLRFSMFQRFSAKKWTFTEV